MVELSHMHQAQVKGCKIEILPRIERENRKIGCKIPFYLYENSIEIENSNHKINIFYQTQHTWSFGVYPQPK
jgi:hypothetical protein